jgi:hypothetical protein
VYAIARTADTAPGSVCVMNTRSPGLLTDSNPASRGWSTSSFGHAAIASPAELSELGAHLHTCSGSSGYLFALQCGGEAVHRFLAPRIVTTFVVAAVVSGAVVAALQAG